MPIYIISECDNCGKELSTADKFLIYSMSFWNNKNYNVETKDFLSCLEKSHALMLCSEKCIGEYISKIINGVKINGN